MSKSQYNGVSIMEYRCKVTVLDKKLFPELQAKYCAVPDSGKCPCFNVGDEFVFYRNNERDDYWHCGEGTLVKFGNPTRAVYNLPERLIAEQRAFRSVRKHGTLSAVISTRRFKAEALCTVG